LKFQAIPEKTAKNLGGGVTFQGCGLGLDVSVLRRFRDIPTSRLGVVLRKIVNVSVSAGRHIGLVLVSAIYVSCPRPTQEHYHRYRSDLYCYGTSALTVFWWACRWHRTQCTGFRRCKSML